MMEPERAEEVDHVFAKFGPHRHPLDTLGRREEELVWQADAWIETMPWAMRWLLRMKLKP